MAKKSKALKKKSNPVLKNNVRKYLWKYYKKELTRQGIGYNSKDFNLRVNSVHLQFIEINKHSEDFRTTVRNVKQIYRSLYQSDWGQKSKKISLREKPVLSDFGGGMYEEESYVNYWDIAKFPNIMNELPDYCFIESKTLFGKDILVQCHQSYDYQDSVFKSFVDYMNRYYRGEATSSEVCQFYIKTFNEQSSRIKSKESNKFVLQIEVINKQGKTDDFGFGASDDFKSESFAPDKYIQDTETEDLTTSETETKQEEFSNTEKETSQVSKEDITAIISQNKSQIDKWRADKESEIAELREMKTNKEISAKEYLAEKRDVTAHYDTLISNKLSEINKII